MSANDELQAHTCEKILEFYEKPQDYVKKSHNVEENEVKSEKTTQDVQKNCLSLTEQWKNGELEERQYFVKMTMTGVVNKADYFTGEFYNIDEDYSYDDSEISEVLAPVPNYEEWEQLKAENRALAMGSFPMLIEAAKKIDKLKELLKECRNVMNIAGYFFGKIENVDKARNLLQQIDEVLNVAED